MDTDLQKLLALWLSEVEDDAIARPLLERLKIDNDFRKAFVDELAILGQLKAVQSSEPRWLRLEDLVGNIDRNTDDDAFEASVMSRIIVTSSGNPSVSLRTHWMWAATGFTLRQRSVLVEVCLCRVCKSRFVKS